LHVDPTAGLAHDTVGGTETESGTGAHPLGGEERFEDPLLDLGRHAYTGIGNGKERHSGPAGRRSAQPPPGRFPRCPVSIAIRPPPGMASRALMTRFIRTWPSCTGSAVTLPDGASSRVTDLDVLADQAPQ